MYIVIEIQTTENVTTIVTTFSSLNEAYSKYYDILKYASISEIKKHGAVILDDAGKMIDCKCFDKTEE